MPWKRDRLPSPVFLGFPGSSAGKESTCNAGDPSSIPGLGRFPGEGNGYPLQYSCLENSMDYVQSMGLQRVRCNFHFFTFQRDILSLLHWFISEEVEFFRAPSRSNMAKSNFPPHPHPTPPKPETQGYFIPYALRRYICNQEATLMPAMKSYQQSITKTFLVCFTHPRTLSWDFPGGPVDKISCFKCRKPRFNPWSGN